MSNWDTYNSIDKTFFQEPAQTRAVLRIQETGVDKMRKTPSVLYGPTDFLEDVFSAFLNQNEWVPLTYNEIETAAIQTLGYLNRVKYVRDEVAEADTSDDMCFLLDDQWWMRDL